MSKQKITICLLAIAVGLCVCAAPAMAQCEIEDTFEAKALVTTDDWPCYGTQDDVVWTNCDAWWWIDSQGQPHDACDNGPQGEHYPEFNDKAVIPAGHCIRVDGSENSPNEVGELVVDATSSEQNDRGRVHYPGEYYLNVHCNSTVDGDIVFYNWPMEPAAQDCGYGYGHLYIEKTGGDQLEIAGDGGMIFTIDVCAKIEGDAEVELDLHGVGGDMTISGEGGREIEIAVALRNRGIVTTGARLGVGGTVRLTGANKRGNGLWRAEAAGTLEVAAGTEVRGAANWRIPNEGKLSTIIFKEPCLDLTGDFVIHGGILELYESICTTGHLDFTGASQGEYWQYADIILHKDVTANFHGDCP